MKLSNILCTAMCTICMTLGLLAAPASAQELTLRIEPAVAGPLTAPQTNRFYPGFEGTAKVDLSLTPWLSIGPAFSELVLPSQVNGTGAGTAAFVSGFARVKRSHAGHETGIKAISPWIEGDLGYVRTGGLDRFGESIQVGAALPTSSSHAVWVGPFVEYQGIFQSALIHGYNTNDERALIVGLSFEFGPGNKPKTVCPKCEPVVVVKEVQQPTEVILREVLTMEYTQTIQFAWDSAVLDEKAVSDLDEVMHEIEASKGLHSAIKVEGHASSEGQVEHNNVLAGKRANAVLEYLAAKGFPRSMLSATGFGSEVSVAPNKTEAGRVANRRASFNVNIVVINEGRLPPRKAGK
jgi:outer membrane protein OmpA-like peptidoglycan-associated protein